MECPYCQNEELKVIDSRDSDKESVWRRRSCAKCGKRFTTYERIGLIDIMVVKRDGTKERFDCQKLINGMSKACLKRPVPQEKVAALAKDIETKLRKRKKVEVLSSEIGDMAITRLKKLDEVAYLRFASIYNEFEDAQRFHDAASQFI